MTTVYTAIDGELRVMHVETRLACNKVGPCFGTLACSECGYYKPEHAVYDLDAIDDAAQQKADSMPISDRATAYWRERLLVRPRVMIGANAPDYGGTARMATEPELIRF